MRRGEGSGGGFPSETAEFPPFDTSNFAIDQIKNNPSKKKSKIKSTDPENKTQQRIERRKRFGLLSFLPACLVLVLSGTHTSRSTNNRILEQEPKKKNNPLKK